MVQDDKNVVVLREDFVALLDGTNQLMNKVDNLNIQLADKEMTIDTQKIELNELQFLKNRSNIELTDTLARIKSFVDD